MLRSSIRPLSVVKRGQSFVRAAGVVVEHCQRLGAPLSQAMEFGFAGLFFLVQIQFPQLFSPECVESWVSAYTEFFKGNAQAGVDYVFTYGPLGCFIYSAYDPSLFWLLAAWGIGQSACVTLLTVLIGRKLPNLPVRVAFYSFCVAFVVAGNEPLLNFSIVEAMFLLFIHRGRTWVLAPAMLFLAAISLVKFTFGVQIYVGLTMLCACSIVESRKLATAWPFGLFVAFSMGIWLALHQSPVNWFAYLRNSLEVASGYSAGMSQAWRNPSFAVCRLILGGNILLGALIALQRPYRLRSILLGGFVSFAVFIKWKHGVVRDDYGHMFEFISFAIAVPFLSLVAVPALFERWSFRLLWAAVMIVSVFGYYRIEQNGPAPQRIVERTCAQAQWKADVLLHPDRLRAYLDDRLARSTDEWQLPRIQARVGRDRVDIFSYQQGVVFVNRLNWAPRPVFQGYCAYTERLLELNANFYRGPSAPKFVLIDFAAIDNRFPAHEDGPALLELLRQYQPVLKERRFFLLERRDPNPSPSEPIDSETRTIRWGEEVAVPQRAGSYYTLALQMPLTTGGQLRQAVYRPSAVSIHATMTNGDKKTFRLVPDMARQPFLLSPLIETNGDLTRFYAADDFKRVASFHVAVDRSTHTSDYAPKIRMQLTAYDFSRVAPSDLDSVRHLRDRFFMPEPRKIAAPCILEVECEGKICLLVHSPGAVVFDLSPEMRRVEGHFGIVPAAYACPKPTDGVEFVVESVAASGERTVLWRRFLDPARVEADKGMQSMSVDLPNLPKDSTLELRTIGLPGHNGDFNWSYWTAVTVH